MYDRNRHSEVYFKEVIEKYLNPLIIYTRNIHTLEDITEFTKRRSHQKKSTHPATSTRGLHQCVPASSHARSSIYNIRLDKMLRLSKERIFGTLASHKLDVLAVSSLSDCNAPASQQKTKHRGVWSTSTRIGMPYSLPRTLLFLRSLSSC